jgi:UDP-glucose 4-epimerase
MGIPSPSFHPHSLMSDWFARCKLDVLVSAGAATCLSTCASTSSMELGQATNAVTGIVFIRRCAERRHVNPSHLVTSTGDPAQRFHWNQRALSEVLRVLVHGLDNRS